MFISRLINNLFLFQFHNSTYLLHAVWEHFSLRRSWGLLIEFWWLNSFNAIWMKRKLSTWLNWCYWVQRLRHLFNRPVSIRTFIMLPLAVIVYCCGSNVGAGKKHRRAQTKRTVAWIVKVKQSGYFQKEHSFKCEISPLLFQEWWCGAMH